MVFGLQVCITPFMEDHSNYYCQQTADVRVFGFVAMFAVFPDDFRFVKKYAFLLMLLALALLGIVMMLPKRRV